MSTEPGHEGVALVNEMARRFQAGDRDGAFDLLHPDFRIEQPASLPHGGWHHGREGMVATGTVFAQHWDRTITDPRILGCGDTVVQITAQTWTSKATGRSADVDVVELFAFADGRIPEIRVFQQDTHRLLATVDQELDANATSARSALMGDLGGEQRVDLVVGALRSVGGRA